MSLICRVPLESIKIQINNNLWYGDVIKIEREFLVVRYFYKGYLDGDYFESIDEITIPIDDTFVMPEILKVWTRNSFYPRLHYATLRLIEGFKDE